MPEAQEPHGPPPSPDRQDAASESGAAGSTVGTGSVLGLGCLVLVIVLVAIAVVFRLMGGTW